MFRLENVSKSYVRASTNVNAVDSMNLEIAQGDYVAIVGPSGSGKTTMLSLLGGMLTPDKGRVLFDEESLYDLPIASRAELRRKKIGFVFQTFNLIPYLTAVENVQIPLFLAGVDQEAQRSRAISMLTHVGLEARVDHKPSEMSVGQQQRVALARTLANNPAVILADEPTGNLDPDSRKCVLEFLDELNRDGRTIVMVTHDDAAAQRAKRRLMLRDGHIQELKTRVAA